MVSFTSLLTLGFFAIAVHSSPLLEKRASTTCGSTYYTADQVNQAAQKSCSYYNAGTTTSGYPHTYNNYEGFTFKVSGPYLEFPMLSSGVYTGGSPGADRVIINTSCKLAGEITHTGASGNNFVACSPIY